uniref:Uncharacterized protein n=1 Tax=Attheya septentrionalis TaxID=420275 RepID=A0A7S2U7R0_9STRA|mmetsp:Transcript_11530/g.21002  ORF Transcript_11530/g.21002 Transcript_11530/m.21002 type:complete len:736 (+) Transcript_11530:3687-5894(+)|eukprot:CAMPEP_0198287230 /NCGR_PEP_ID=MMETSP1449-20131203/6119_1 /TAXON_ID=420275 /ORGANISM="Attheya septentrionalis, Strain CCMP2084" /LENGTH=735 /DNA_ID=CAMNT_0043985161 /DNA_START=3615 /DNA_END=5822 /DNA_ORIENTATION=-
MTVGEMKADEESSGHYYGVTRSLSVLESLLSDEFSAISDHLEDDVLEENTYPRRCSETHLPLRPSMKSAQSQLCPKLLKELSDLADDSDEEKEEKKDEDDEPLAVFPCGPQAEGVVHTKENFEMYKYLKGMPACVKSMEHGRNGDHQEPLKDTIVFAMHHIDGKSLGGLCVLREWGATTMYNVFVGYNPTVVPGYFEDLEDMDVAQFQATILMSVKAQGGNGTITAEATYKLPESASLIRCDPPLPVEALNETFLTGGVDGRSMTFLEANRCLAGFLFLRSLAEAVETSKRVIIFEDGGYLNPMLEEHIDIQKHDDDTTISAFRKKWGMPEEPQTDAKMGSVCLKEVHDKVFVGTCELTRNGYDATRSIYERREAATGRGYLNTRFFSIACSHNKIKGEGNNIALACLNALKQVLYSIGWSLSRRKVIVLGSRGNLGRSCCQHLVNIVRDPVDAIRSPGKSRDKNVNVWGVDMKVAWPKANPEDTPWWNEAWDEPVPSIGGEVASYKDLPKEARLEADIIFGWTGGPKVDIKNSARHGTYDGDDLSEWLIEGRKPVLFFASGSTKTAEFKDMLDWISSLLRLPKSKRIITSGSQTVPVKIDAAPIPDTLTLAAAQSAGAERSEVGRNFGIQFAFSFERNGSRVTKVVYLVNKTMPINFMFYGTATEIMDMTYAQCCSATAKLSTLFQNDDLPPGLYPTDYSKEGTDDVYLSLHIDKNYNSPPSSGIAAPPLESTP